MVPPKRNRTRTGVPAPSPEDEPFPAAAADQMSASARQAAALLKSLGHERRLMILCHLTSGEKSVGELEGMLGLPQAVVSQQLARLRLEGLVAARRDGKAIHYRLADPRSRRVVELLYELYCAAPPEEPGEAG